MTPDNGQHSVDPEKDEGRAIIEVIWLSVLVLIPVIYLLISLIQVQASTFAVHQAAREAARLLDTAPSAGVGMERARAATALILNDQHVSAEGLTISYVLVGSDCATGPRIVPDLSPGSSVDVCITVPLVLPLLPEQLTAANTVTGVYTLRTGEFREQR